MPWWSDSHACALVEGGVDVLVQVGDLAFEQLGDFLLAFGHDLVDAAAVGQGLLDSRLGDGGLHSSQFLRVLGGQHGAHVGGGIFQNGAGGVQVQRGQTLDAGEGAGGQGQQGLDVGLGNSNELLGGDELGHDDFP